MSLLTPSKMGPPSFNFGSTLWNRLGPLNVKRGVIFRHGVFSVGLFSHFDVADWIAALFDVVDLRGCVLGRAIKHGDGNHGGKIVGQSAREEEIESRVLIVAAVADICCGVPGIDGRGGVSVGMYGGIFCCSGEFPRASSVPSSICCMA